MLAPKPLTSPRLLAAGFVHGFFTREGGYSDGAFASLNCSFDVGDDPIRVEKNLTRVCESLALEPSHLVTVTQVHGSAIAEHHENVHLGEFRRLEADAVFGRSTRHGFAVRTADCIPVLVGCRRTGLAAAIHAGWRGIVAKVVPRAIEVLIEQGCCAHSLVAAIGPHIGLDAFEVSGAVAEALQAVAPDAPAVDWHMGGKPHVALSQLAAHQLRQAGLQREDIEIVAACTYSNEQRFFSFRRDGKDSGRQVSVIRPR